MPVQIMPKSAMASSTKCDQVIWVEPQMLCHMPRYYMMCFQVFNCPTHLTPAFLGYMRVTHYPPSILRVKYVDQAATLLKGYSSVKN